ncbi:MAG TPA: 50S ribosomal protein L10 [Flavobacteriales bacterium]|mgnify:CR=1 FL=1|jgi:large subunit ribosomal protein L10|nr:50S ribosomal protein L10 [Flavobacteriales bacterium]MBK6548922.1 50S ribosomal protein L10 [Flavobacteriales bacterium]MBK7100882.1 50S ribosomal protein L10 [Flavobacteriales bacterium]MBK7111568.1 50S ribosomal protein L10 [Flavobacteriales bacterium]MBK7618434.1 50S ribosomal protein L10 [Flavobacteriales bacterium]
MATRIEKDQAIEVLVEEIKATNVLYLADTSSMSAEATSNLRRTCHKSGIRMKVVKNTLLQKAMERIEGRDYSEVILTLKGQTSVLFADKGNAPAKMIKDFRKKDTRPVLKSAWIDEAVFIGDDQLVMLSTLKGKEELIGEIIGLLQSPLKNVLSGLQGSGGQKIAGLLKTLEERAA